MLVLVIDDELTLRTVCKRLFNSMGHSCETAANVDEVVALTTTLRFDLIICDYRLGHETAEDVIAALQVAAPDQVRNIVLASGDIGAADVTVLAAAHGLRVIGKPFGRRELETLVSMRIDYRANPSSI